MYTSDLNFDRFVQEANEYVKELADKLGHPEEIQRTFIAWKAVMHTIRDRIQISESFDLMSQLPMILKGVYVQNWKYSEKPPKDFDTIEQMCKEVKALQAQYGESEFKWEKSTEEIIRLIFDSLKKYLSEGQLKHVDNQLPKDLQGIAV